MKDEKLTPIKSKGFLEFLQEQESSVNYGFTGFKISYINVEVPVYLYVTLEVNTSGYEYKNNSNHNLIFRFEMEHYKTINQYKNVLVEYIEKFFKAQELETRDKNFMKFLIDLKLLTPEKFIYFMGLRKDISLTKKEHLTFLDKHENKFLKRNNLVFAIINGDMIEFYGKFNQSLPRETDEIYFNKELTVFSKTRSLKIDNPYLEDNLLYCELNFELNNSLKLYYYLPEPDSEEKEIAHISTNITRNRPNVLSLNISKDSLDTNGILFSVNDLE